MQNIYNVHLFKNTLDSRHADEMKIGSKAVVCSIL